MKRGNRRKSKYLYIIIIKNRRRNINSMSPKLFVQITFFFFPWIWSFFIEYEWLYSLSSSSSATDKMNDLTLRVKCSIRRYWYLNAHHLMIVVRDSRTSIQIWNTKIWSHSSDGAIFNISSSFNSRLFFLRWIIFSFHLKMSSVDEWRSSCSNRKTLRHHTWEIVFSKKKLNRKDV